MTKSDIAIQINGVSKVYQLWASPNARLAYPFRKIVDSIAKRFFNINTNLAYGYRDFHALHNISFEIEKGESWGFIGVNGSGKSTLLKMIAGNLRPSSGRIEVIGKVAILDYSSGLSAEFSGRENIFHKGVLLGLTRNQIIEKLNSIIEFAGIGDFIDQPVKTYSSGMAARLGFAIMAHVDADILITDEALAVGDAFFVQKCMSYIHRFLKHGTFLFVSHSVTDVMTLCNKAVWLEDGRVLMIGNAKEVCQAYMDSRIKVPNTNSINLVNDNNFTEDKNSCLNTNTQLEKTPIYSREISLTSEHIAKLKNYFSPLPEKQISSDFSIYRVIEDNQAGHKVHSENPKRDGGKIIGVELTNKNGHAISTFIGGEEIILTIRIVAEKKILHPLIGFQFLNHMGLSLIGENTGILKNDLDFSLEPTEVASAKFRFYMPLLAAGEYVIRASFHQGTTQESYPVDVAENGLLILCNTIGERHGLAGVPLLNMQMIKEKTPIDLFK